MAQKRLVDYTKKKTKKKKARKKSLRKTLQGAQIFKVKRKGRTYKVYVIPRMRQIGRSNELRDLKRKALPPGRRVSKSGRVYYEYRKNRSDLPGLKI